MEVCKNGTRLCGCLKFGMYLVTQLHFDRNEFNCCCFKNKIVLLKGGLQNLIFDLRFHKLYSALCVTAWGGPVLFHALIKLPLIPHQPCLLILSCHSSLPACCYLFLLSSTPNYVSEVHTRYVRAGTHESLIRVYLPYLFLDVACLPVFDYLVSLVAPHTLRVNCLLIGVM